MAVETVFWTNKNSVVVSVIVCFVVLITCVARAPSYQSSAFIWTIFDNQTGWANNPIVFIMGMVAENYMYTGIDGVIHMSEEVINPSKAIPLALVVTLSGGFVTTFTLCIALLYSAQNYTTILGTVTGFPIYELMAQACRSDAAATVFMVLFFIIVIFTELPSMLVLNSFSRYIMLLLNRTLQAASRLTWALARDDALVFSPYINRISGRSEAPIYAALANWFVMFIIGFTYLGSPWVFE